MKIAVIGSGISGLSSAYFLSKKYKVDLYEKDDHFGGHSFTYEIKENNKIVPVDLGFIVFNEVTIITYNGNIKYNAKSISTKYKNHLKNMFVYLDLCSSCLYEVCILSCIFSPQLWICLLYTSDAADE